MKAYKIDDYHVAAFNWMQAVGTLAAHLEVEPESLGKAEEVNPKDVVVHFEKDDGTYEPGTLEELMPAGDAPEVMLDPDYS